MGNGSSTAAAKHYGKYRGFVADNKDPEKRGRLKLIVPSVFGETQTNWAEPCLPFGGLPDQGFFMIPEIDSQVFVEFEEGDVGNPLWTGCFWQQSGDIPSEADKEEPTTRIIKTPKGHILQFDDGDDEEQVVIKHFLESTVVFDNNGSILLSDANENRISLDADSGKIEITDENQNSLIMDSNGIKIEDNNGNLIELAAAGITINGQNITIDGTQIELGGAGSEPVIKGQSFLGLFATHMHTCTAPGSPTSPPVPQGEMSTLTMKTKAG